MCNRALAVLVLLVSLATPAPARAQEAVPAWPAGGRAAADWISTGAVAAQVGVDLWRSYQSPDRKHLLAREAKRIAFTVALAEVTKHFVHRTRPDGSDRHSFYSEHTALAIAAGGWSVSVSVPISTSVAYLRMAANKHFPTDVLVGTAAGAGAAFLFR